MANRAYLRVWTRDFSASTLIEQFVRFLATAPLSAAEPHFLQLTVQSLDASETPVADWDLRGSEFGAAEATALAAQHFHADTAYFVAGRWDLWQFDAETLRWQKQPAPLTLICHGPEYEDGIARSAGHFVADLGLEHHFTGDAGLLQPAGSGAADADTGAGLSVEHTFRRWMATEANLREYHHKMRENIQQLLEWTAAIERALPVERTELSSEGEENFEAKLDSILATR